MLELLTYVHGNADCHELGVEAYKRLILDQAMLLYEPNLHGPQEVPVESSVYNQDQDLGYLVPNVIDLDEGLADWRHRMCGYPDTKHSDVDSSNENDSAPLDIPNGAAVFGNEGDAIYNNLHKQLNLKNPEEENEEEDRDSELVISYTFLKAIGQ